ncbi:MAG: hypothetical protein J6T72_04720 [Alphaproteobacteria bacterium]|nr:hypothetical protein [Alphaproteobacteria bacterium]
MRSHKFFRLCLFFAAIATIACVAVCCTLWIGTEINKPLSSITSAISIAATLTLLVLEVIVPAFTPLRKKAKKLLIPMTAVALLASILGLIMMEYTVVSRPVLIIIYGVISLLDGAILLISAAYYSRFR